jgi:hypothetical protein
MSLRGGVNIYSVILYLIKGRLVFMLLGFSCSLFLFKYSYVHCKYILFQWNNTLFSLTFAIYHGIRASHLAIVSLLERQRRLFSVVHCNQRRSSPQSNNAPLFASTSRRSSPSSHRRPPSPNHLPPSIVENPSPTVGDHSPVTGDSHRS